MSTRGVGSKIPGQRSCCWRVAQSSCQFWELSGRPCGDSGHRTRHHPALARRQRRVPLWRVSLRQKTCRYRLHSFSTLTNSSLYEADASSAVDAWCTSTFGDFELHCSVKLKKRLPERSREFESVICGMLFVVFTVFALPIIVSAFTLLAAVLNEQGGLATLMSPDTGWSRLLSFGFRISMIPGISYLAYRGFRRLYQRGNQRRLLVMLASLTALTVLLCMPPRSRQAKVWITRAASPQAVQKVLYKIDRSTNIAHPDHPQRRLPCPTTETRSAATS
jgi:hypothetical protein